MPVLPQKKVRKGTKSCVECRRRKVKCIFLQPSDDTCQRCVEYEKQCSPQIFARQHRPARQRIGDDASYDRLSRLEQRVSQLANSVVASKQLSSSDEESASDNEQTAHPDSNHKLSRTTVATPPSYLKPIFDNGNPEQGEATEEIRARSRLAQRHAAIARGRLLPLMPSREDVETLAIHAGPWMSIHHAFFPAMFHSPTSEDILPRYDSIMQNDDLISLAAYLITLAMTATQLNQEQTKFSLPSVGTPTRFVKHVAHQIRDTIVNDNELATTTGGIEIMILYARLQLSRGDVRDMWLTLRRALSISEFLGLHRAAYRSWNEDKLDGALSARPPLFEAVCAVDRMTAMMFNLPAASSIYVMPEKPIMDSNGQISLYGYMLRLTAIASSVQEIDEDLAKGLAYIDVYSKVLVADSKLRSLESAMPWNWFNQPAGPLEHRSLPLLLQSYLTVRTHLHSVMHPHTQFTYSWHRCIEAAQRTIQRFLTLRPALPGGGFFLTRLFQIQILTTSIVLLLSSQPTARAHAQSIPGSGVAPTPAEVALLVNQVIEALEQDGSGSSRDFASRAAIALQSLQQWLDAPDAVADDSLTLNVPMLGKMAARRARPTRTMQTDLQAEARPPQVAMTMNPDPNPNIPQSIDMAGLDSLSWLLELDIDSLGDDSVFQAAFNDLL